MLEVMEYDRRRAVEYARRWALSRNPLFYDFTGRGGNCTNFVSQCLLAGCCRMNFTPTFGWYYISPDERTASWTGVEFLYNFLIDNASEEEIGSGVGPFAVEVSRLRIAPGDVIQLGREEGDYYHTLLVTGFSRRGILVAAQSDNALDRPLSSYSFRRIRYLHILGYRADEGFAASCFDELIAGTSIGL